MVTVTYLEDEEVLVEVPTLGRLAMDWARGMIVFTEIGKSNSPHL
jgi:hypothetical protein